MGKRQGLKLEIEIKNRNNKNNKKRKKGQQDSTDTIKNTPHRIRYFGILRVSIVLASNYP